MKENRRTGTMVPCASEVEQGPWQTNSPCLQTVIERSCTGRIMFRPDLESPDCKPEVKS